MWEAIVSISWLYFSIMRYHSLRRFPVPLVSTGIFRKASIRRWRFINRVPCRESSERGRVREGEKSRFKAEAPRLEGPMLVLFRVPC